MGISRSELAAVGNFGKAPSSFLHTQKSGKPTAPDNLSSSTVTITIASPGVVTWTAHGLIDGRPIKLSTTGTLPTGLTAGTTYYVVNSLTNTFQLEATVGGGAINTSGSQSGTHTAKHVLNSAEQDQFNAWLTQRTGGTIGPNEVAQAYLPNVQTMIGKYETYFAGVDYIAWAHQDLLYRDAQWRSASAGALLSIAGNATLPVSLDSTGSGANAPSGIQSGINLSLFNGSTQGGIAIDSATDLANKVLIAAAVKSNQTLYVTDFKFTLYVPTASVFYILKWWLKNGLSYTQLWEEIAPAASGSLISIPPVDLRSPLVVPSPNELWAEFHLLSGSPSGCKGFVSATGYYE